MATGEITTNIPEELRNELQEALNDLGTGIRRPEKVKAARAHMDHVREENRKLFGEQTIAVELIRRTRDDA
jgi:hypothetical protein